MVQRLSRTCEAEKASKACARTAKANPGFRLAQASGALQNFNFFV